MTASSLDRPGLLANDALAESLPSLLALATALTGSPEAAARLVAASLTRRPALVRDALANDLPETRLRSLVVQQFLARRSRRREPSAELAAMPPRQRAAVVLRDGLQLTPLEIAAVLDRPAAGVIAALDAAPDHSAEIAALMGSAPGADAVGPLLETAVRDHRRHRVRFGLIGLVAVVLVAGLVAIPTVVLPRLPAASRAAGEWRYSSEVRPDTGWTVVLRTITATSETTEIKPPVPADDPYTCWVRVNTTGTFRTDGLQTAPTASVHGRPAITGTSSDGDGFLAWEYGENAWAQAYCSTMDADSPVLRGLAAMMRFRPEAVRLPFSISSLPAPYSVNQINSYPESGYTELSLTHADIEAGDVNLVVSAPLDRFDTQGTSETVAGRAWRFLGGEEPRMCHADEKSQVICVTGVWPGGNYPDPPPYPVNAPRQLRSLVSVLTPAANMADSSTWPTGAELPR